MGPKQETMEKIISELLKRLQHEYAVPAGEYRYPVIEIPIKDLRTVLTHAIEAHDREVAEKIKFEIAGLAGMSNQIQDSGQAHIFEMKLGNILALLNKQI